MGAKKAKAPAKRRGNQLGANTFRAFPQQMREGGVEF